MPKLLFEPINIGKLKVRNRIAMPPMATNFSTADGELTQRQIKYYEERAKGGVGLIITESCYVHPNGKGGPTRLGLWSDKHISGFQKLADAVHKHDTKIIAQIHHAGALAKPAVIKEYPVSCSNVPSQSTGVIPRCLTEKEIDELVAMFGQAARRAKEAGLDGIEIHAAHEYLIHQFLSPLYNKRTDKYGGHLANRMRFLVEIIECIRKVVGNDFPLVVRYVGDEFVEGGLTLGDATIIARVLEKSGANALDISGGSHVAMEMTSRVPPIPQGSLVHLAAAVKEVVRIPVATVGGIREMRMAEEILQSNRADIINLGRPLIADPELPKKWAEGRANEVRRCTSCNEGCHERMLKGLDITCTVNPMVGKEHDLRPTPTSKRVMVVGGGPAGMEVAVIASLRGHKVSLFEKKSQLGGQLILAACGPFKQETSWIIEDLEVQLQKQKVSIHRGQEVTPDLIEQLKPEVLIFATGALPLVPDITGVDKASVISYQDVLSGRARTGDLVLVIGGGSSGVETSEFLAERGKKVIICEMLEDVITDVERVTRKLILRRLSERGVRILINCKAIEIRPDGLVIKRNEIEEFIGADTVVLSAGAKSNREIIDLFKAKKATGIELYEIGDCIEPRKALDAIREGAEIGEQI
jgi:2,4-dienoyl-CoA reductase-like NADH-dependent reductase (Old Yellow Enzyme family)/thioredoxin reductase